MPSQLMSHSTLCIGKVKMVSPPFFLTIQTFADYLHDRNPARWAETAQPPSVPRCQSNVKPENIRHKSLYTNGLRLARGGVSRNPTATYASVRRLYV